jgi:hypothetical protein
MTINIEFKKFTTKAKKAHEGGIKPENPVLRVPLCALVVYILLLVFFSYQVI